MRGGVLHPFPLSELEGPRISPGCPWSSGLVPQLAYASFMRRSNDVLWERWDEIDRILDQALERPEPERAAFIRGATGPAVRAGCTRFHLGQAADLLESHGHKARAQSLREILAPGDSTGLNR